jgi:hypothetical protein
MPLATLYRLGLDDFSITKRSFLSDQAERHLSQNKVTRKLYLYFKDDQSAKRYALTIARNELALAKCRLERYKGHVDRLEAEVYQK